jgi:hypothetical protein
MIEIGVRILVNNVYLVKLMAGGINSNEGCTLLLLPFKR